MDQPAAGKTNAGVMNRVLVVRGLRGFADGFVSLLLPAYLLALGLGPTEVGVIATATLLGSAALTLLSGKYAWRFQYRQLLLAAALLMMATGFAFAGVSSFWPILVIAAVGTLNPSSGDVSVFLPLEHALLSHSVPDNQRTSAFARYSLVGSLFAALGALAAVVPDQVSSVLRVETGAAMQAMFVLYGILGLVCFLVYRSLPRVTGGSEVPAAPLGKSRKKVYLLAALFSLDSFGGGLVVQSILALWLYQRFELSPTLAGTIFFWTGVLSSFSYLVAVRIARRIGLVNTMVFTHLPANVCLVLVPFVPSLEWAFALLLVRSALSQMDVPVRSAFVMQIVSEPERPAAASITSVPRSLASAFGPGLAGYMLTGSAFGWPLVVAGALKIIYDLLLLTVARGNLSRAESEVDRTRGPGKG